MNLETTFSELLETLDATERSLDDLRTLFGHFSELHLLEVSELRASHVDSVRLELEARGVDPAKSVRLLKRLVRFASSKGEPVRLDEVTSTRTRTKRRRHVPKAGVPVTLEDVARIRGAKGFGASRWASVLAFGLMARRNELRLARWEDLDRTRPVWFFTFAHDKSGRCDVRALSPKTRADFEAYVAEAHGGTFPESGYLFANSKGEAFNRWHDFGWDAIRASLPEGTRKRFHDLRSGGISALVEAGLSLEDVAHLARHEDASLTAKKYLHADPNGVAKRLAEVAPRQEVSSIPRTERSILDRLESIEKAEEALREERRRLLEELRREREQLLELPPLELVAILEQVQQ